MAAISSRSRRRGRLLAVCLTLLAVLVIGIVGSAIAAPAVFKLLPDQYQRGLARRVSLFEAWLPTDLPAPTRSYLADNLPTANSGRAAQAIALLNTPISTAIPATMTALPPTVFSASAIPATTTPIVSSATVEPTAANVIAVIPTTGVTASPSTDQPADQPTTLSTSAPSAVSSAIPSATATSIPLPAAFQLGGYKVVYQGWNNCGPANLTQIMNAYGVSLTQDQAAGYLKPSGADKNVSPWRIAAYVNTHTAMRAIIRYGGSLTLIKQLLNARFRPLIETGFVIPTNPKEGWMGHYLTPAGYDDTQSVFMGFDTYLGDGPDHRGNREDATDLDTRWAQFNRVYLVIYSPEREGDLMALLGADADPTQNLHNTLAQAKQAAQAAPQSPFAWFNIGTTEVLLHNYQDAAAAYDQARNVGSGLPWRMLWYQFGPLEAYTAIGDYKTALQLIAATLGTTPYVEDIFYWRGMVEALQGNSKAAITDFHNTLNFNPNYLYATDALHAVQNGQLPTLPDVP